MVLKNQGKRWRFKRYTHSSIFFYRFLLNIEVISNLVLDVRKISEIRWSWFKPSLVQKPSDHKNIATMSKKKLSSFLSIFCGVFFSSPRKTMPQPKCSNWSIIEPNLGSGKCGTPPFLDPPEPGWVRLSWTRPSLSSRA